LLVANFLVRFAKYLVTLQDEIPVYQIDAVQQIKWNY